MSGWLIANRVLAVCWLVIAVTKVPWLIQLLADDWWRHVVVVYATVTGFGWIVRRQWTDENPPWRVGPSNVRAIGEDV